MQCAGAYAKGLNKALYIKLSLSGKEIDAVESASSIL